MLMAYDAEGWKGASREKLKPHAELTKARDTITRCLQIMRDCVKICDEAGGDKAIPRECFDEEGEVDCNDIFCGRCRESDSTDDNDIIMVRRNVRQGLSHEVRVSAAGCVHPGGRL
jgi:hypothetical protein